MAIEQYANNATTTLNGAINNSTTTVVVTDASSFPSTGNFRILVEGEIMLVTSVSSNTFTVATRGSIESTAAASHADATPVAHILTSQSLLNVFGDSVVVDTLANIPSASRAGRLFFPTDAQKLIYRDNGSSWDQFCPGRAAKYPPFTPSGVDDEFDDNNFSGWTLVDDGTHQATVTEANDVASVLLPGGDSAGHVHAYMKSASVSSGDYIEMCFRELGQNSGFPRISLIFADGTTYNSGNQVLFGWDVNEGFTILHSYTGYNTQTAFTLATMNADGRYGPWGIYFFRMKYNGSNSWTGYVSVDGISWLTTMTQSYTLTPTQVGFCMTTWTGSVPHCWSLEYFRKSS